MAMSLLERYDEMQRRPFGTNTALSDGSQYGTGGTAGSQFRRQEQAYSRALRLLDRQARRGDARSAMAAIDVREKAMESGYAPGGIRKKAEADQGILSRISAMDAATKAEGKQAGILGKMADEALGGADGDADGNGIPDSIQRPTAGETTTVNPNATPGAGRGTPLGDDASVDPGFTPKEGVKGIGTRKRPGLASRWDSYRGRMA